MAAEKRELRSEILHARLTPSELAAWREKAAAAGVTPSELLRQAMGRTRTWTAAARGEQQRLARELARIGSNLNQIARWANTYKRPAEAAAVLAWLAGIERDLRRLWEGRPR